MYFLWKQMWLHRDHEDVVAGGRVLGITSAPTPLGRVPNVVQIGPEVWTPVEDKQTDRRTLPFINMEI
jgi:hypothetical protein